VSCQREVNFLETDEEKLFKFTVEGPRQHYYFEMKLINEIKIGVDYQTLRFKFTPRSTYIGMNQEDLILEFLDRSKIVSASDNSLIISNSRSTYEIYDRSDAIPENTNIISRSWGFVIGFGTISTFLASFIMKMIFGAKFNLGWGLINFIQIIAFIPLADFYFPGNVRSYVSLLKVVNTAGKGFFNPFYFVIDETHLNKEPFSYRFDVMGIDTTIFVDNFGFQMFIFLIYFSLIPVAKLLKYFVKRYNIKNKIVQKTVNFVYSFFSYNTITKMMILMYMFAFLSSVLTWTDLKFANIHEVNCFIIGALAFLFLILFIFSIFTVIQKCHKKMEEDPTLENKLSSIIKDIDYKNKTCARFYIPIYLLRKAVFMMLVLVFDSDYKELFFAFLVFHCIAMLAICIVLRPYKLRAMNLTAIFNELMITVIMSFSGVFLQTDMDNDVALQLGWVWIALANFTIIANWLLWIGIQIYEVIQRKKAKIAAEEKKSISKKVKVGEGNNNKNDPDPHDFGGPDNEASQNVKFVSKSQEKVIDFAADSHYTMMSPFNNTSTPATLDIYNHYDCGLIEEEKVPNDDQGYQSTAQKYRNRKRKLSDSEGYDYGYDNDLPVPFGYSPTKETSASPLPNKALSNDASDELTSQDSNRFSITEVIYPTTKPSGSSKFIEELSEVSSNNNHGLLGTTGMSTMNILRVQDL
jgi:large-conductance mechanosensitive channel